MQTKFLGVADVAKILGVVPERVRQLERAGEIPAERTVGGVRIFRAADVAAYLQARTARRAVA